MSLATNLLSVISDNNPIIKILNKEYEKIEDYLKESGYTIADNLHCYSYNYQSNTVSVSFTDSYTMRKIRGLV